MIFVIIPSLENTFLITEEHLFFEYPGDFLDLNPIDDVWNITNKRCEILHNNKNVSLCKCGPSMIFCVEETIRL